MKRFLVSTCLLIIGLAHLSAQSKLQQSRELYERALESYRVGDLDDARINVDGSIGVLASADAHYLSGLIYEADHKDLRAVSAYEACVRFDENYHEAIFQKALIYLNYGDPSQALKDFDKLVSLDGIQETRGIYFQVDPTGNQQNRIASLENLKSQLHHYRGQAHQKLNQYKEAMADYDTAIAIEQSADYYISKGLLYADLDRNLSAKTQFQKAIAQDSSSNIAWYNLALIDSNIHIPEDLLKDSSFGPTLALLASKSMENGDYRAAKRYYDRSLTLDKRNALGYVNRGRVHTKLENYHLARKDFDKARLLEPSRIETLYLTGNTYFFENGYDAAIAYYNQYVSIDPSNATVWYNAAMSYLELESITDACHYLKKSHDLGMVQAERMIKAHCADID